MIGNKRTYAQAKKDFSKLDAIKELEDCVEIDAKMFELLERPTRAHAQSIYESCIDLWYQERVLDGEAIPKEALVILEFWGCI